MICKAPKEANNLSLLASVQPCKDCKLTICCGRIEVVTRDIARFWIDLSRGLGVLGQACRSTTDSSWFALWRRR